MPDRNGRQTQRPSVMPIDYGRTDRRGPNRPQFQYRGEEVTVRVQKHTLDIRRAA